MEASASEFPMGAHPKPGEKGGCPYSSQQPFDAVPRQVVSFGDTDAVEYQDYEASFNPLKPFHALSQRAQLIPGKDARNRGKPARF
jgi:hypothetical protein